MINQEGVALSWSVDAKTKRREAGFSATIHPSYESHLVPLAYGIYGTQ
jgi:hypothetical protein